jgi:hypothetical protein
MAANHPPVLNEQIFELRFKPEARILDHRGIWTEQLQSQFELSEWLITENRLDVYNKDNSKRIFVAFRNAGCTLRSSSEASFVQLTQTFLRFLLRQSPFRSFQIERIGVLGRFANTYTGSFEDLLRRYAERIYSIAPRASEAFDAELTDIGGFLDFRTAHGEIHSAMGPMQKKQLLEYFDFAKEPPEIASFFQFDYFTKPATPVSMNSQQLVDLVAEYTRDNWARYGRLSDLLV